LSQQGEVDRRGQKRGTTWLYNVVTTLKVVQPEWRQQHHTQGYADHELQQRSMMVAIVMVAIVLSKQVVAKANQGDQIFAQPNRQQKRGFCNLGTVNGAAPSDRNGPAALAICFGG
jgi:hypothetical protein